VGPRRPQHCNTLNGSTKIWYAADALGSVRRTVGTPESGTVPTLNIPSRRGQN
jgi:hypothetical protein